jgi:hypothetical protein
MILSADERSEASAIGMKCHLKAKSLTYRDCSANGGLQSTPVSGPEKRHRRVWVVHAHPLAGAERRLYDPQRPLTHDRLLYVLQQPLGRIASMPATGHDRS